MDGTMRGGMLQAQQAVVVSGSSLAALDKQR
jgi:hypothetical protein